MRKTVSFGCRKITANLHRNRGLLEAGERLVRQKVCSFCLARVNETMGITYAIGRDVALVGRLVFKQHLDITAIISICMVLGGAW